jgi:hypothetical protein
MRIPFRQRESAHATQALFALGGAAVGAALMYFLHPGRRAALPEPLPPDDDALAERVRFALGRVIEDPSCIEVRVRDGCVVLKGLAVPEEADELVACAARVAGVRSVENRLAVAANT